MGWTPIDFDPTSSTPTTSAVQASGWTPINFDPTKEEPPSKKISAISALGKGVKAGALDIASGIGTGTQYLGGRLGSETLQTLGKEAAKYWKPEDEPASIQGAIFEKPELMKDPAWWAYNVGRTGTSMAPGLLTGLGVGSVVPKALSKVVPALAGGLVGGAQEGVSTYQEILDRGGTESQAARGMEAMTTGSSLLNALSFGKMLKPGKLASLRRLLTTGLTEAGTEYAEEPVEVLIKKGILTEDMFTNKEAFEQLKQGLNVLPVSFVTGMGGGVAGGGRAVNRLEGEPAPEPSVEDQVDKALPPELDNTPASRRQRRVLSKDLEAKKQEQIELSKTVADQAAEQMKEGQDTLVISEEETSVKEKSADVVQKQVESEAQAVIEEKAKAPAAEEQTVQSQVSPEDSIQLAKAAEATANIDREGPEWSRRRAYRKQLYTQAGYDMDKQTVAEVDEVEATKPMDQRIPIDYAVLYQVQQDAEEASATVKQGTDLSDEAIGKVTQELLELGQEELTSEGNLPLSDPTATVKDVTMSMDKFARIKAGLQANARLRQVERKLTKVLKGMTVETKEEITEEEALLEEVKKETKRPETAEEWNAQLAKEGMPEEPDVETARAEEEGVYTDEYKWAREEYGDGREYSLLDDLKKMTTKIKQASESAKKAFDEWMDGTFTIRDNSSASNLLVAGYGFNPATYKEAVAHLKQLIKAEAIASKYRDTPRRAWSKKAIARAIQRGEISKEAAKYVDILYSSLKVQPNMKLEVDPNIKQLGLYELANNLMVIKTPKVLAHEIMHWSFYNVLTSSERIAYYQDYIDTFYTKKGRKQTVKAWRATSSPRNALKNPSEMFACRGSDVFNQYKLTETEKTLFYRVLSWFKGVSEKIMGLGNDLDFMNKYFDQIFVSDATQRTEWAQAEKEEDEYTRTVSTNRIDAYDYESVAKRASLFFNSLRQAKQPSPGDEALLTITGKDGTDRTLTMAQEEPTIWSGLKEFGSKYVASPMMFKAGIKAIRHVYNLNRAEQFISSIYESHRITIDKAEGLLNKQERLNVRAILEGKKTGNAKEMEAAGILRTWLNKMKEKYKLYMLNEYKMGLNKTEYNALLDIIAGVNEDQLAAKYPKLKTEVIEEIAKRHKEIDEWGIDNYVPNVERGRYKIVELKLDKEGRPYKKLVAIGLSVKDAQRKAAKYLTDNPDAGNLQVDTSFMTYMDDKAKLNYRSYFGMMNKLAKTLQEDIKTINDGVEEKIGKEEAKKLASKTMRRRFILTPTDPFNVFLQPRHDVLKGEEDIFPVLRNYAYNMEKTMALEPVISVIRRDMKNMTPEDRAYVLDLVEDVKGRYTWADKQVDKIFGTYRGYSRLVGHLRTVEAWNKLGYRPVAAAINLASGQMHTWIKTGTKYYLKGINFLRTEEGKAFIEKNKDFMGTTLAVEAGGAKARTPMWHPLGLFQAAEPVNREVSMAANYIYAKEVLGYEDHIANEYAIRANWVQQFTYNIANLPKFMRGPTGRLVTQFKPYLLKEIEFMSTLSGTEWIRYAGMQLALGGPRGLLMILRSLPILATFGFWEEAMDIIEEWMNKDLPVASRGVAALPSLIKPEWGADVSAAATFQFPNDWLDLAGPTFSDLYNIGKNVIVPMTTYGLSEQDAKRLLDVNPAWKYWNRLIDSISSPDDNWLRDRQGNKLYEITDSFAYLAQNVLGVENIDINRIRAEEAILNRRERRLTGAKTRVLDQALTHILNDEPLPDDLIDQMMKHGVDADSIIRRVTKSELPPALRNALSAEIRLRPEILRMYPDSADHLGILP